jgi:hypothetical protein
MKDVVVVSFPCLLTEEQAKDVKAKVKAEVGDDAIVIVVSSGAKVTVDRAHPRLDAPAFDRQVQERSTYRA